MVPDTLFLTPYFDTNGTFFVLIKEKRVERKKPHLALEELVRLEKLLGFLVLHLGRGGTC
jgi:hypothetical protein